MVEPGFFPVMAILRELGLDADEMVQDPGRSSRWTAVAAARHGCSSRPVATAHRLAGDAREQQAEVQAPVLAIRDLNLS